jgi:hypothetical protein
MVTDGFDGSSARVVQPHAPDTDLTVHLGTLAGSRKASDVDGRSAGAGRRRALTHPSPAGRPDPGRAAKSATQHGLSTSSRSRASTPPRKESG